MAAGTLYILGIICCHFKLYHLEIKSLKNIVNIISSVCAEIATTMILQRCWLITMKVVNEVTAANSNRH